MNRLVLIDGNAVLHRAYHAIPPLTAPDGSVVNAVYGFGTMLVRLINDLKPTHVAVAFDRPKPTFRKKLFAEYQAKRPKMDAELVDQIPKVHALVSAFGIPIFENDGFEADDVIGTLALKALDEHEMKTRDERKISRANLVQKSSANHIDQVIIVTGDRDLLQLVKDDEILVWMPVKGLSEAKLYGEKEVEARLGVLPKLIPDYKALAGDASDNYPGVPGIGPKTAVRLLEKYKSIQAILKTNEFTEAEKESARMSHDLATIRTNVPLEGAIIPLGSLNRPEAVSALTTLGFRTLLKRIIGEVTETEKKPAAAKTLAGKQESLF